MTIDQKAKPTQPKKLTDVSHWDIETDVVVVGYGGAGSCSAIEASDTGADVIIFEASSAAGGSTALSSAEVYMGGGGGTRVQQACGYDDKTEDMISYLMQCVGPQADAAKIRAYCEGSQAHFDWLVDQGVPLKDSELKERAIMALTDDCLLYTGSEKAWLGAKGALIPLILEINFGGVHLGNGRFNGGLAGCPERSGTRRR